MYENFVEEVDAVDNGISQWEEGEPRYAVTTTLSARVARLNPTWNQPNQDTEVRRAPGGDNEACKTSGEEMRVVDLSNVQTSALVPMIPRLGSSVQWIWFERSFCRDYTSTSTAGCQPGPW